MNFYQLLLYDESPIVRSTRGAGKRAGKRTGSEKDSTHQEFSESSPEPLPELSIKWQGINQMAEHGRPV